MAPVPGGLALYAVAQMLHAFQVAMLSFRLLNIPVRVQPFFFVIGVLLWYYPAERSGGVTEDWPIRLLIWMSVMFTGVLAHEFGHALVGRAFGLVPAVELYGMGGLTYWPRGKVLSPLRHMAISVAGPGVGIAIGLAAVVVMVVAGDMPSLASYALSSIVWVNLGWGVLNLAPMMPLDGGNIMASFFELFARGRGRLFARYLSLAIAALIVAWALYSGALWIAFLVGWMSFGNFRAARAEAAIGEDLPLGEEIAAVVQAIASADRGAGDLGAAAASRIEDLLARAKTPKVRAQLVALLAQARLIDGDPVAAREALTRMPPGHAVDPGLEGGVLLLAGEADRALPLLVASLDQGASPSLQLLLAKALVERQDFNRAVEIFSSRPVERVVPEALYFVESSAYQAGAFAAAARLGELLWKREGKPVRAFNVACSLARAGHPEEALGWLGRAKAAGFAELDQVDGDADLASVRALGGYPALRQDWNRTSKSQ